MVAATTSTPSSGSKPIVNVFYENLCPDSVKFISDFYKLFVASKLNESMIVKMNPYGNSNTTTTANGSHVFSCEHGYTECYKNMIHGCVIKNEANNAAVLKFVNCSLYEAYYNTSKNPTDECAQSAGINITAIHECMNTSAAATYLFEFGMEFKKMGIDSVPAVGFNNSFNKTVSAEAIDNFSDSFCNFVKANNWTNEYCKSKENSATIPSVSLLTFVIASVLLVKMYQ